MQRPQSTLGRLLPALVLLVVCVCWPSPGYTAEEPILVIVHPSVPEEHMSDLELEAVFTLSQRYWEGNQRIAVFNYPAGRELRTRFDRVVLRMDPEEMARFWTNRLIRGQGKSPATVPTPSLMARVIEKLPGSIGYVPESTRRGDVRVVARIVRGKVKTP